MRTPLIAALLLLTACANDAPAPSQPPPLEQTVQSLLAVDQAAGSSSNGLTGLVDTFDEEVVLFAIPVAGFAHGKAQAADTLGRALGASSTALSWAPIRAGVSADGEHGFTFGYVSSQSADAQTYLGKYVAYWVRDDGQWRIRLYKLAPRPEGEVSTELLPPYIPTPATGVEASQAFADSLAQREREFSDVAQNEGLRAAFTRFGRPDAVNIGDGAPFTLGAEAIGAIHPEGPSPLYWSADQGVLVAPSGDLGVTWGFLHRNGPTPPGRLSEIPFFTIWARDNTDAPWFYIAE